MTNKERFFKALKFQEPDRVPYFDWIDEPLIFKMGELLNLDVPEFKNPSERTAADTDKILELKFSVWKELDIDAMIVAHSSGEAPLPGKPDLIQDRYGIVYQTSPLGEAFVTDGPVKNARDLKKLEPMKPRKEDFQTLQFVREKIPERVTLFMIGDTFKWSWRLLGGMENLLMNYIDRPDFSLRLARVATDYVISAMHMAIDHGADAILMDGDLAYNSGPIMSPDHYRKFIKPFYDEICQNVHGRGVSIVKHSDGNVWPIFDDIMDSGFDGFNPIEPGCMDIAKAKEHLKGRACVIGNIDCAYLLPFGTEDEVVRAVQETIKKVARGGGYMLSSSNSIHPGCKAENAIAMFRAARTYGTYPIALE